MNENETLSKMYTRLRSYTSRMFPDEDVEFFNDINNLKTLDKKVCGLRYVLDSFHEAIFYATQIKMLESLKKFI